MASGGCTGRRTWGLHLEMAGDICFTPAGVAVITALLGGLVAAVAVLFKALLSAKDASIARILADRERDIAELAKERQTAEDDRRSLREMVRLAVSKLPEADRREVLAIKSSISPLLDEKMSHKP